MNVVSSIEKEIAKYTSPEKEKQFDVKEILQETKHSLESLKKSVDDKKITEADKPKTLKYLDECVAKIVTMQGITESEKTMLLTIKSQIEAKNDIETINIIDVIAVISALEQKAEQLNAADQEKIKALRQVNVHHKSMLEGLKLLVSDVQERIKEKKQEYITKIKEDLEQHRWSSRLAKPAYEYLMKKYIRKEEIGKFENFIMGTVGLTIVGRFVSKDLSAMIGKIGELKLEDFDALDKVKKVEEEVKNALKDPEQLEKIKDGLIHKMHPSLEKLSGRTIDKNKFHEVFAAWFDQWKGYLTGDYTDIMEQIHNRQDIDPFANLFSILSLPAKAGFDLIVRFADTGIFNRSDILVNGVVKNTGKMVLEFGIGSLGLFANAIKIPFGLISTEEFAEYAQTHIDNLNVNSKMAFWGLLYRRGGWFRTLAGRLGQVAGEGLGLLLGSRTSGQITSLSAYRKGGIGGNTKKQIEIFKQLEDKMESTGVFKEMNMSNTASLFQDLTTVVEKNMLIFDGASTSKTAAEFETFLKKNGLSDIAKKLDFKKSLSHIKNDVGVILKNNMLVASNEAKDSFGKIEKLFGKKIKLPWSKYAFEKELLERLVKNAELQDKMLSNTEFFSYIRKFFTRFEMGKNLSGIVEHGDRIRFNLKDVNHAKEFFDNIGHIGRTSPEILKVLFKGFPLIMVGDTVLDDMNKPGSSLLTSAMRGMLYITPLIGPFWLVKESLVLKGDKGYAPNDIAGAGIGLGMFALDGFFAVKALHAKSFRKFMASPVLDAGSFMKSMGKGAYGFLKMTKDGINVLRTGGTASFGAEGLAFLRRTGIRITGAAILVWLGYLAWQEVFDTASAEEKEELKKLEGKSHGDVQEIITKEWAHINDTQKAAIIKLATAQKLGITNLNNLDVKKTGDQVLVSLNVLVSKDDLIAVKSEVQDRVSEMEGNKKTVLNYSLNGGEIKEFLLGIQKEQFTKNDVFDAEGMKKYLLEMGYSEQEVADMMQKVV